MRAWTGLLSIAGLLLGILAVAEAASPFDGTYQVASSTKVNQTHVNKGGDLGYCPDRKPGPLTVADGLARYTTESGVNLAGQLAPNGEFEMRFVEADGTSPLRVLGDIDDKGKAYARQMGNSCAYDYVWQKQ
jgi:hypothetical protein